MKARPRVCVIGGTGFIGTPLTSLLVKAGREVIVMGRSVRPARPLPHGATYIQGDYGDRLMLKKVLSQVSEVVDLAYATAPQTSFADPVFDVIANLPPSVNLLQQAVAEHVERVVLVSSGGTVYGVARELPISEDHPKRPISPYGITKLATENYAWMFNALFDLPVVVVRPANAYGEGQRTLSGQGFIASAMRRVLEGREIEIYGEKGTIRDYIHVTDVAAGIVAALEKGIAGTAYNVGTGEGRSNLDIVKMIEALAVDAGLTVRTRFLPARKFDVPANYLDSKQLHLIAGWHPRVTLQEGLERLWRALSAERKS